MQSEAAGFRRVRSFAGSAAVLRRTTPVLAIAAALLINACASDSSTGPIADAGLNSRKPKAADTTGTTTGATTPTAPSATASTNPIAGALFWIDPLSSAKKQADAWRATRPSDAAQMDKIASHSQAQWFGGWTSDIYSAVNSAVTTITAAGALPVFVAYNIPQRDCGGLSGGGATP